MHAVTHTPTEPISITPTRRKMRPRHRAIFLGLLLFIVLALGFSLFVVAQRSWQRPIDLVTTSATTYETGDKLPLTNPDANQLVLVNMRLSNRTEKDITFSPLMQTWLTDESGVRYPASDITTDRTIRASMIGSRQSVEGQTAFETPKNIRGLTLHFKPSNYDREITMKL